MKSKIKLGLAAAVMAGAIIVSSNRAANADNILLNGGFEDGVYTSTLGAGLTNTSVPNNWIPNQGYDSESGFNRVNTAPFIPVHSGTFALQIGNEDSQDLPSLSQTFSDVIVV